MSVSYVSSNGGAPLHGRAAIEVTGNECWQGVNRGFVDWPDGAMFRQTSFDGPNTSLSGLCAYTAFREPATCSSI